MTQKAIGIGVIGTGFGSYVLLPAFKAIPGVAIIGIASRDSTHAANAARVHDIRSYASYDELLRDPAIDAVVVALPPGEHPAIVHDAAKAGKHVFCEKPIALSTGDARRMVEAAQKAGIVHMVDFEFREFTEFCVFRRMLTSGALGALESVSAEWLVGTWADPTRSWSWKCDLAQGGGVLTALGIHMFDLLELAVGPMRSVHAKLSTCIDYRPLPNEQLRFVTAEDTAEIDLQFLSGISGTFRVSNVQTAGAGQWLTVIGTKKSIRVGSENTQHYGQSFDLDEKIDGAWKPISLQREVIDAEDGRIRAVRVLASRFIDAIRTGKRDIRPSFIDGLRMQIILDAVRESDRLGTSVEIAEPSA